VGSANVWDESTRAALRAGSPPETVPQEVLTQAPAPRELGALPVPAPPVPPAPARESAVLAAPNPFPLAPPPALSSLTTEQEALFQRLCAEVPGLDQVQGLRQALATLIARAATAQRSATSKLIVSPELELLRRRATKLVRALKSARTEIKQAGEQAQLITGISSVYRSVQGLSVGSDGAKAKRGMLEDIFRANLDLRRQAS
jgi:hypothetical protein